jgi:hypothetical protein
MSIFDNLPPPRGGARRGRLSPYNYEPEGPLPPRPGTSPGGGPTLLYGYENAGKTNLYPIGGAGPYGASLVPAPTIAAPDGTMGNVSFLQEDNSAANFHELYDDWSASPTLVSMTGSFYAKAASRTTLCVFYQNQGYAITAYAFFDVLNGRVSDVGSTRSIDGPPWPRGQAPLAGPPPSGRSGGLNAATIQRAANGFWKCSMSLTPSDPTEACVWNICLCDDTPTYIYDGDGVSGAYLWNLWETSP